MILFSALRPAVAAPGTPGDDELRAIIAGLDARMFDAYNAHDVDGLMAWFAPELEFYHDTGGLLDYEQVKAGFTSVFANNADIRRELVPGTLEVYPIKDYGAIQLGSHRFCHTEKGQPDCGTFRFVQVWRLKDGRWQVVRELSYGH
jgi:ketosteroid isomerase-like protein